MPVPRGPLCLGGLLPQGSLAASCSGGFSHHLVTMGSDLPPVLGMVTWFTSAACLFFCPLPGERPCVMDCSVLFSLCAFIDISIHAYMETQIQAWISQLSPSLLLTD